MDIPERKIDYLFNQNIAPDFHNTPRAIQNAQQMQRLGLWNTPQGRQLAGLEQQQKQTLRYASPFSLEHRENLLK